MQRRHGSPNMSASIEKIILLKEGTDFQVDNTSECEFDGESNIGNLTIINYLTIIGRLFATLLKINFFKLFLRVFSTDGEKIHCKS